jgi:hypothetical protein
LQKKSTEIFSKAAKFPAPETSPKNHHNLSIMWELFTTNQPQKIAAILPTPSKTGPKTAKPASKERQKKSRYFPVSILRSM